MSNRKNARISTIHAYPVGTIVFRMCVTHLNALLREKFGTLIAFSDGPLEEPQSFISSPRREKSISGRHDKLRNEYMARPWSDDSPSLHLRAFNVIRRRIVNVTGETLIKCVIVVRPTTVVHMKRYHVELQERQEEFQDAEEH